MKKINLIIIVIAALIGFNACENDPLGPFVEPGEGPLFTAPTGGSSFVLTEETEDDIMTYFTWTPADFGFQAEVSYELMMAEAGTSFAEPIAVKTTNNLEDSVTVGFINNLMLSNEFAFGVAHDMEIKLRATIHEDMDTLYSDVLSLTITPFEKIIIYPSLYVAGDYWDPNWSPGDSPQIYSLKSNDKYEGYINIAITDAHFKFTSQPDWNGTNYGYDTGDEVSGTLSTDGGAGNLWQTNPAYLKVNVNIAALTYDFLPCVFGIVGSAVPPYDWATDVVMTYDPVEGVWTVTEDLVEGALKFRANGSWDAPNPNYGSNDANGIANEGGTDIPVPSDGNYTITLDLKGPLYRYTLTKN